MEELHTDSIDGGHEASYGARSRARERAYSNNYRQLNAIIVKNRYTLSLIYEMQNRIKESKIFIKINIKKRYYKIRMKKDKE
jgi:hypothetical protein